MERTADKQLEKLLKHKMDLVLEAVETNSEEAKQALTAYNAEGETLNSTKDVVRRNFLIGSRAFERLQKSIPQTLATFHDPANSENFSLGAQWSRALTQLLIQGIREPENADLLTALWSDYIK